MFQADFRMLVNDMNENLDSISLFAAREMATFRDSISVERKAIMLDLDATSNKIVKTAMQELKRYTLLFNHYFNHHTINSLLIRVYDR